MRMEMYAFALLYSLTKLRTIFGFFSSAHKVAEILGQYTYLFARHI
jgi:hypothetical protein